MLGRLITLPVSKFSHKILENVPGIPYDPNNIHTTIFTYQVQNTSKFNPDKKIITSENKPLNNFGSDNLRRLIEKYDLE